MTDSHIHEGTQQAHNFADIWSIQDRLTHPQRNRTKHTTLCQIWSIRDGLPHPMFFIWFLSTCSYLLLHKSLMVACILDLIPFLYSSTIAVVSFFFRVIYDPSLICRPVKAHTLACDTCIFTKSPSYTHGKSNIQHFCKLCSNS